MARTNRTNLFAPNATLAEIAGTTRGLSKLTVDQIEALLDGKAPAKKVAEPKAKSEFYEKVIVARREDREKHHKANTEAAAWMRSKGLVASGQAWSAVKNGERGVKALKALNDADGLKPPTPKAAKPEVEAKPKAKATKPKPEAVEPKNDAVIEPVTVTEQHVSVTEKDIEAQVQALIQGGFSEADARLILG